MDVISRSTLLIRDYPPGKRLLFLCVVALASGLAGLLGGIAVPGGTVVRPAFGVALVFGVFFGAAGSLGSALGYLASRVATGSLTPVDLFVALAYFLAGYLAYYFLLAVWRAGEGGRHGVRSPRTFALSVAAVVSAVAGSAATTAWAYELFDVAPFSVAPGLLISYAVSALLIGLPVAVLHAETTTRARGSGLPRPSEPPRRRRLPVLPLLVPVVWLVVGTIGSLGYRAIKRVVAQHPHALEDRGLEFLLVLQNDALFGVGAGRVQIVFGSVMLSILTVSVHPGRPPLYAVARRFATRW